MVKLCHENKLCARGAMGEVSHKGFCVLIISSHFAYLSQM